MPSERPSFRPAVRDGVLCVRAPGARWLSTGVDGGFRRADAAYNLTVPAGFSRTDVVAYATDRRREAGFDAPGPALLTGVEMDHARGARSGDVVAYATAGLSNPAALPVDPAGGPGDDEVGDGAGDERFERDDRSERRHDGTVNLLVGTNRALSDGALATLLAVAVEAKAATLLAETWFPGTTTDAVVAGTVPNGEPAPFSGSGTPVGAAARACVREAVRASLGSRYPGGDHPTTVDDAEHGVRTERTATVFRV